MNRDRHDSAAEIDIEGAGIREADLTGPEFAETWRTLSRLTDDRPSAGFADRLKARLRAEAATSSAAPVVVHYAPQPIRLFPRWALGLAAAAAVAAVAVGLTLVPSSSTPPGFSGRSVATTTTVSVSVGEPDTAAVTPSPTPPAEPDLAAVPSVPENVLAAVDRLAEMDARQDALGREIAELASAAPPTAPAAVDLSERFPFLERTFEETLEGL
jgi:hypothetical protein